MAFAQDARRAPGAASFGDRLKTWALAPLPQHLVSRAVLWLTRRRSTLVTPAVRRFARAFDVDMRDAVEPDLGAYDTFNAFFTRALKPEARPIAGATGEIACPADGTLSAFGSLRDAKLLQAKGIEYSIAHLLAGDADAAERLGRGSFATVYLSPRDYHRLHMPIDGRLLSMTHVPGRLWSVGAHSVRALDGLFVRNERVVAQFDTAHGRMALVLVGAINVAAIETVWHGLVTPPQKTSITRIDYTGDESISLARGAEMGRFNMGSSVIALFERPALWHDGMDAERTVLMGQGLGRLLETAAD